MKTTIILSEAEYQKAIAKMKKDIRLQELWKTMETRNLTAGEREIFRIIVLLDYGVNIA